MINLQWTKERNRLKLSTVKAILSVVYNCRHVSCKDFFEKVKGNKAFLEKVRKSDKYQKSEFSSSSSAED
jgi:hypothetical protein